MLVTDWNPLTVWVYDECYIRLAAQDYDPNSTSKFAHLTNNCVVKQFNKKEYGDDEDGSDDDAEDMDNIMSREDFAGYVQNKYKNKNESPDIYKDIIWP